MTIRLNISTDQDIIDTGMNNAWAAQNPPTNGNINTYNWGAINSLVQQQQQQQQPQSIQIANNQAIVVVAHGNADSIGNANNNIVNVSPTNFIAIINYHMANNAKPHSIYLAVCLPTSGATNGLAAYAANVSFQAQNTWFAGNNKTRLFSQNWPAQGDIPSPNQQGNWLEI